MLLGIVGRRAAWFNLSPTRASNANFCANHSNFPPILRSIQPQDALLFCGVFYSIPTNRKQGWVYAGSDLAHILHISRIQSTSKNSFQILRSSKAKQKTQEATVDPVAGLPFRDLKFRRKTFQLPDSMEFESRPTCKMIIMHIRIFGVAQFHILKQ